MNRHNGNSSMKYNRNILGIKRRLKSIVVRDKNGSINDFRHFYQSGGRDYEQYRTWLQAQAKSDQLSIPLPSSSDLVKIKVEPIGMVANVASMLAPLPPPPPPPSPSLHLQQQPPPIPRIAHTHPLLKSVRHLSLPDKTQARLPSYFLPSPQLIASFESQLHPIREYSHMPTHLSTVPVSYSSFLSNWSVNDVAQFLEKHFPDKKIARKFILQQIDGRTLPLLTEDHLTRVFKMKLGPTLHLLALVSNMQMQNQSNDMYQTNSC